MNPWTVGDSPVNLFTLVNTARESLNPYLMDDEGSKSLEMDYDGNLDVYTKTGVIVYYEGNDYTLTSTPGWNSHKFTSDEYKIIHSSDFPIIRHIVSGGEW